MPEKRDIYTAIIYYNGQLGTCTNRSVQVTNFGSLHTSEYTLN